MCQGWNHHPYGLDDSVVLALCRPTLNLSDFAYSASQTTWSTSFVFLEVSAIASGEGEHGAVCLYRRRGLAARLHVEMSTLESMC